MATTFNDNNAWIQGTGNLTLGAAGSDDGQGHATYGYAKNDVTLPVNAAEIVSDTQPVMTYATGDIPKRTLVNATHKVAIPLPQWFVRTFQNTAQGPSNPHGILVKSLTLYYRVNTSDLTSITGVINSAPMAAGAALPTVTAMTTSVAGGTLTQAANTYALVITVTTPAFLSVANTLIWGLATVVVPTNTCDILGASWQVAYAMY